MVGGTWNVSRNYLYVMSSHASADVIAAGDGSAAVSPEKSGSATSSESAMWKTLQLLLDENFTQYFRFFLQESNIYSLLH